MRRMTLDLSDEIDDTLTALARRRGITKAEAMRKAFALLVIADSEARKAGFSLGIVRDTTTTRWSPCAAWWASDGQAPVPLLSARTGTPPENHADGDARRGHRHDRSAPCVSQTHLRREQPL
ncbi:hypothetical protein EMIT0194MI4_10650 [Pseudomonas sp. IT-194MI4]|uniref:ribbon-helix-helix domain-containing protein n=1 Tax=Pseudomonas sp. IT-194MI4 TaxID=3026443 RepID=UPI0039DFCB22